MANLMSAVVSVPGHIYQLLMIADEEPLLHRSRHEATTGLGSESDSVNCGPMGTSMPWLDETAAAAAAATINERDSSASLDPWYWHQQGLDGLTVLVSLASVLSILLISLDRYYVRLYDSPTTSVCWLRDKQPSLVDQRPAISMSTDGLITSPALLPLRFPFDPQSSSILIDHTLQ